MDKLTKQAHLLHSLLFEKKHIHEQIAKSISKNFSVPIDEAMDKCSVLITGLLIHMIHLMIIEKMKDGKLIAQKFLANVGKSDSDIKGIHETFGDLKTNTQNNFKEMLEDYLGVATDADLSDWYYMRIKCACESIIEIVGKQADKIELRDGAWDYTDSTIQEKFVDEIESITDDLKNRERVCPCCKTKAFFFGGLQFKGKDKKGFLNFECPNCKRHLQYDSLKGNIKIQKDLLGFLFSRFSKERNDG